jgi:hypothetical protein
MRKKCEDCGGQGQRIDETTPCPSCLGRGELGVDVVIEGRLYQLFPEEMLEVEDKHHAKAILTLKEFRGVVEVKEQRKGNQVIVDADGAIAISKQRIRRTYETRLAQYVQEQREGPMAAGKPPIAPTGIYLEAIEALGVDLPALGINPPAYQVSKMLAAGQSIANAEVTELRAEVKRLTELVGKLVEKPAAPRSHKKKPAPSPVAAIS